MQWAVELGPTRHAYFNVRLAIQKLRQRGYQRIGLVYSKYLDEEANGSTRSGFLFEQEAMPENCRIPILLLERFKEGRPVEFDNWYHRHKPDVVLCVNPIVRAWLEGLGLSIPGQVGVANLNIVEDLSDWSGIVENHMAVGAAAVDLILSSFSRNEIGLPPRSRKILVPGEWREGATLLPAPAS